MESVGPDVLTSYGVHKKKGNSYTISVKKLELLAQERIDMIVELEEEKKRLLDRESVLVDLVLQQENHIKHLDEVQAMHNRTLGKIDKLLAVAPSSTSVQAAAEAAAAQHSPTLLHLAQQQLQQHGAAYTCNSDNTAAAVDEFDLDGILDMLDARGCFQGLRTAATQQQQQQQPASSCKSWLGNERLAPGVASSECPSSDSHSSLQLAAWQGSGMSSKPAAQQQQLQQQWNGMQQQLGSLQFVCPTGDGCSGSTPRSGSGVGTAATTSTCGDGDLADMLDAPEDEEDADHFAGDRDHIAAGTDRCTLLGGQYCHHLLMNATQQHWDRAMSMTSTDWSDYLNNLVMRLCLLMELLGRLEAIAAGRGAAVAAALTGTAGMAAAATAAGRQGMSAAAASVAAAAASGTMAESEAAAAKRDTLREVDELVDDFVTMVNLCMIYNPMPVREMSLYNLITGERTGVVPAAHWQQVNERLDLTDEQVLQLQHGYHQYLRVLSKVQEKQRQLAQAFAKSTAAAAAARSCFWQAEPHTAAAMRSREAAVLAAALHERQLSEQLLQQHMAGWTAAGGLLLQFYCNTLTRLQISRLLIGSYPYLPRMDSLIDILLDPKDSMLAEAWQSCYEAQAGASRQDRSQQLRRRHGQQMRQHQHHQSGGADGAARAGAARSVAACIGAAGATAGVPVAAAAALGVMQ